MSIANGQTTLGHGYYLEDIAPGMEATVSKTITNEDVLAFAGLSGDINPVHLDDESGLHMLPNAAAMMGVAAGGGNTSLARALQKPGVQGRTQRLAGNEGRGIRPRPSHNRD